MAYVLDSRTYVVNAAPHRRRRYRGHHAWDLLCKTGRFPPGTPATLREAIREPRLTPAELVDRHGIADAEVKQLITDYLVVRAADLDYSSSHPGVLPGQRVLETPPRGRIDIMTGATQPVPPRDDPATITCPICQAYFTPAGRQTYCSTPCRKTAFRRRHQTPPVAVTVPAARHRRDYTIYECPDCGERLHGQNAATSAAASPAGSDSEAPAHTATNPSHYPTY